MKLGLTDEQRAARKGKIGGSDANTLMNGDAAAILRLWEEKTGKREPENLDDVLPVIMGQWSEPLNAYWFKRRTGRPVAETGTSRVHPVIPWMACTLDGMTTTEGGEEAIWEAKHVNQFSKMPDVTQKYMPQLHHNMAVCGVSRAVLSVFIGTMTWECDEIKLDQWYLAEIIDRERAFWEAIQADTPPPGMDPVAAPTPPEEWRTVDMTGSNEWASAAADWLENRDAARAFGKAEKAVKEMVEDDVGMAFGHGLQVKRSKNRALRISELKNGAK